MISRRENGAGGRLNQQGADDSREREYGGHLAKYYDEVIACMRSAEALMVFGPGEAKSELRKRIERNKLDLRITSFETSDKMTERQISQKARRYYLPPSSTASPRGGRTRNRRPASKST